MTMLLQLLKEANQLFNEANPSSCLRPFFMDWDDSRTTADLMEQDKQYILRMDLPGFKKEDVKVEIKDHRLSIEANRPQEYDENKDKIYRSERRVLNRKESYTLPDNIIEDKIQAKVEDGILSVSLPKKEASKPKLILIKIKDL